MKIFSQAVLGICAMILVASFSLTTPATAQDTPDIIPPASGAVVSIEGLTPAEVLARVRVIQAELEQIRFEMGKPPFSFKSISVKDAQPRQVLFQATSMFSNTGRLYFEISGRQPPTLRSRITKNVRPGHAWMAANDTYWMLVELRKLLELPTAPVEQPQPPETSPTDVLEAVIETNRMLHALTNSGPTSEEVLHRVMLAEEAVSRLLATFPGAATRTPGRLQRGKTPADVYVALYNSLETLTKIAAQYDFETIQPGTSAISLSKEERANLSPARVYDLATLVSSELIYLYATQSDDVVTAPEITHYVLPSHVFQHVEALQRNMTELELQLRTNR